MGKELGANSKNPIKPFVYGFLQLFKMFKIFIYFQLMQVAYLPRLLQVPWPSLFPMHSTPSGN